MLRDTVRDLQWRRRRFAIAIAGAGLVFAMTLLLAAVADSFRAETARTVDALGFDAWVVRAGSLGSFGSIIPASSAGAVVRLPGVERADPVILLPQPVRTPSELLDANVFGHRPGGVGTPPLADGRAAARSHEAVVDGSLDAELGAAIQLGRERFTVVGRTKGLTLFGGRPNVYAMIEDVQRIAFGRQAVVTAVAVRGEPGPLPPGLASQSPAVVRENFFRPVRNPASAIDTLQILLWIIAACIIGVVVYLSALERARDFAVLKAIGTSTRTILGSLAIESTIIAVVAAGVASGLANLVTPAFPFAISVPGRSYPQLVAVAVVIGVVASGFGIRRATSVDPVSAFGGP